jgi:hypothetical protein
MLRRTFLVCGILASLLYVGIDILAAIRYPGYHSFTAQSISELMARGAPTERLVDPFFLLYDGLMLAFGVGVWMSDRRRRARVLGGLLLAYATLGLLGPTLFEMNVRGSGESTADVLHIALTAALVFLILWSVALGASLRGRWFRLYSFATLAVLVIFGVLTSLSTRGLATGEPTPWLGIMERTDIGAFLLWVVVLAVSLLGKPSATGGWRAETRKIHGIRADHAHLHAGSHRARGA